MNLTIGRGKERSVLNRFRKQLAQLIGILLCALTLKQFYSTANVNELRWILAPTTVLVEVVNGSRFEFESYAGYIDSDRSFLIAASCAGVNFLLTAFLMLSLGKLWRERARNISWRYIPAALIVAYLTTLIANTVRIVTALWLRRISPSVDWLDANQLHRVEGIVVYFGFLLLLYVVSDRMDWRFRTVSVRTQPVDCKKKSGSGEAFSLLRNLLRQSCFPLLIYYATTLGIPLATAAYRPDVLATDFWNHLLFVLLTPIILVLPFAAFRCYRAHRLLH
ncbi:MAG: exosortase K [Pyrinomonadaceae bacterium]